MFKYIICVYLHLLSTSLYDIIIRGDIMSERKNSEARIKANNRYNEKAYDRINIAVPKGEKDKIKAHAEKKDNGSINGFVNRAIRETMERDNVEGNE